MILAGLSLCVVVLNTFVVCRLGRHTVVYLPTAIINFAVAVAVAAAAAAANAGFCCRQDIEV